MKHIINISALLFVSSLLYSQSNVMSGTASASGFGIGDNVGLITSFSDQTGFGFTLNDIRLGAIILDQSGTFWEVDSVYSSNVISATISVNKVYGLSLFLSGSVAVMNSTNYNIISPPTTNSAGITPKKQAEILNYSIVKIDSVFNVLSNLNSVSTSGVYDSLNQEIDITVTNGVDFSIDVSALKPLTEAEVDTFVANNGYLTQEADSSITNELQFLSLDSNILSLTQDTSSIDLSIYLDNTDSQTLSFDGDTLTIAGGNSIDLSSLSINTTYDYIQLDTSFNNTDFAVGEMGWDDTGSFRFGLLDNYSFAVGQDIYKQAHNNTASAIPAGTAVMMTGADGNSSVFTIAPMNYPTIGVEFLIGIVAVDIPAGSYGVVVQNGYVRGLNIDAEGWSAGDVLYLDETSAGGLTTTPGGVLVAAVTKAGTNGSIYVRPDFYAALSKAETDAVGAMVSGNTETLIDVTYQADSTIDFVVNDDLSLYDNSVSGFLTAEVDGSVTNEIQDLSLSGNTLSLTGDPTTVDLSSVSNWVIDGTNIYSDISTSLDSATYSFAAGASAGSNRDMDYQIAIGRIAGQNNTGTYQNAFGLFSGGNNTGSDQNAFGREAGKNNTGGYQNAFGLFSGENNTGSDQNAFGREAGGSNTGSDQNAFGRDAGKNNIGNFQNAFGLFSGRYNTGSNQNAFGQSSGQNNTGNFQNAFGLFSGENNTGSDQNAFGREAGKNNQGDHNINIGYQSGFSVDPAVTDLGTAAGDYNTWLNYRAGYSITQGDDNIGIGYDALYDLTTGDNNIALGRDAGNGLTTQTNTIAIGRSAIPGASGEIRIGNSTYYSNTVFPQKITAQSVANDNTATKIAGLNASDEIVYLDESDFDLQRITDNGATTTNNIIIDDAATSYQTEIEPSSIRMAREAGSYTTRIYVDGDVTKYDTRNGHYFYDNNLLRGYVTSRGIGSGGTTIGASDSYANLYNGDGSYISQTIGGGATYPYNGYGNLIIAPRSNAARDIVFASQADAGGGAIETKAVIKGQTGRLGLRTTSPSYLLHVNGTVGFTGISDGSSFDQILARNSTTGEVGFTTDQTGTDDQTLSFTNPNLSIENGNSVDLSSVSNWVIDGTNIYSDISNSLDSATYSFAAGANAGSNRNMSYQNAIGYLAGQNNTGDSQNAFGSSAGRYNAGDFQNAFGLSAGQNNTGANQNAFSSYAGENNTAANQNAFGRSAGQNNTGADQNSIGAFAGQNNTGYSQNAFGTFAGQNNAGGYQNAFGTLAGRENTGDNQNAFGQEAGENNTASFQNAIGYFAGQNNIGDYQNAFGRQAGENNTGRFQNAFGLLAGQNNTDDNQNAFGPYAGQNNTGFNQNAFGRQAGENNIGNYQNAFGYLAGQNNTGANQNAFGYSAGRYNQGSYNVSIGFQSGYSVDVNTTPLGAAAGNYNTWLNYRAGYSITEGNHNIGIGYDALYDLTTGDYNIALGRDAGNGLTTQTNTIAIGRSAIPAASGEIRIGNSTYYSNTVFPQKITAQSVANDNTATKIAGLNASDEIVYLDESDFDLQRITDNGATTTNDIVMSSSAVDFSGNATTEPQFLTNNTDTVNLNSRLPSVAGWNVTTYQRTTNGTLNTPPNALNNANTLLSFTAISGYGHQLAFNNNSDDIAVMYYRRQYNSGFGEWKKVLTSDDYGINTVAINDTSTSVAFSLDNYSELHLAVAATTTNIVIGLPTPDINMVGKKIKIFNFLGTGNRVTYGLAPGSNFFLAGSLVNAYIVTSNGKIDELTCIPDPQSGGYVWAVEQN